MLSIMYESTDTLVHFGFAILNYIKSKNNKMRQRQRQITENFTLIPTPLSINKIVEKVFVVIFFIFRYYGIAVLLSVLLS